MSYIPTPIKSIQQVVISLTAGSGTATLSTAVVPGASLLIFQGLVSNDNTAQLGFDDFATAVLTNSTTVTATRQGGGTWALTWYGVVIEYLQTFVKSVGGGTIAIADGASSNTATITAVDPAKTLVVCTGWQNANSNPSSAESKWVEVVGAVSLTNATTITGNRGGTALSGTSCQVGYRYIEFK